MREKESNEEAMLKYMRELQYFTIRCCWLSTTKKCKQTDQIDSLSTRIS